MASIKAFCIALLLPFLSSQFVYAQDTVIPCPFNTDLCNCTNPQHGATFFDSATCISKNGVVPTFSSADGTYIVIQFDLTFNAHVIEPRSFVAFSDIFQLDLIQTLGPDAAVQTWQPLAFYGPNISAFQVTNVAGVIPPPPALLEIAAGLQELQFVNCRETVTLGGGIFSSFASLTLLQIQDTSISNIDDAAFAGLEKNLGEIWLLNTNLAKFPSTALKPLLALYRINLTDSNIQSFAADDFASFSQLAFLDLDGNNAQAALNAGALNNLPKALIELSLQRSNPPLTSVPSNVIANAPQISILALGENNIAAIHAGDFPNGNQIGTLQLSGNPIATIDSTAFQSLNNVVQLLLSKTQLVSFDFSLLSQMHVLLEVTLDGSPTLKSLSVSNVDLVPDSIRTIDASNSGVQVIDPNFDQILSRWAFQTLDISNNQINCDPSITWMARYVLCDPVQIISTNTKCSGSGTALSAYLSQSVPNACDEPGSSTTTTTTAAASTATASTGTGTGPTAPTSESTSPASTASQPTTASSGASAIAANIAFTTAVGALLAAVVKFI